MPASRSPCSRPRPVRAPHAASKIRITAERHMCSDHSEVPLAEQTKAVADRPRRLELVRLETMARVPARTIEIARVVDAVGDRERRRLKDAVDLRATATVPRVCRSARLGSAQPD